MIVAQTADQKTPSARRRGYPKLAFLILPLTRVEVRGWGRLLQMFRVTDPAYYHLWDDAPSVSFKGKWHGYRLTLALSDWSQRLSYFLGRYHDLPLQLLMAECLKPGDRFVDVGANIGLITLYASWLVGKGGRVDSFEPNPTCFSAVKAMVEANSLANVHLHNVALSDSDGEATLTLLTESSVAGTLADLPRDLGEQITGSVVVETRIGAEVLAQDPKPVKLVKIDVEGFEMHVLKGLTGVLSQSRPAVVTEVIESQLRWAGSGRKEIAAFFSALGYEPYSLGEARVGGRMSLRLERVGADVEAAAATDFLWLHPEWDSWAALRPFLADPTSNPEIV